MSLEIDFSLDTELGCDEKLICDTVRSAAKLALGHIYPDMDAELSVTLTGDEGIRILNRRFRHIDRPTDVLSFPMYTYVGEDVPPKGEIVCLGDTVISVERARDQAARYGHSLRRECAFLTVHSVLHLLGYDHETGDADERRMFAIQDEIMEKLDVSRDDDPGNEGNTGGQRE